MFGGVSFGGSPFAGIISVTVVPPIPPVTNTTGWPFADDLEVPDARLIPHFNRVAEHARAIQADDEEIMEILSMFLNRK